MSASATDHRPCPVGRLAPSPTGLLHLGHARSFLLAWWHIRARGGRMILRLEDLDGDRVKPGMGEAAIRDLAWLGLDWDGPVQIQSEGHERLRQAVAQLTAQGAAYPCVCSRADIRAMQSAPQLGVAESRYPGTCRGRYPSVEAAELATGKPAGLRFIVPDQAVTIGDGFAPSLVCNVQHEIGDFLIARRDGSPAYQLAVVVDDAHQGVTEVLRGDDLLSSTARQWHLQEALGLGHPEWFHVPLVLDHAGRRLAKRADDLSLATLREQGTDPRATAPEILPQFSLGRVPTAPVRLTAEQLRQLAEAR